MGKGVMLSVGEKCFQWAFRDRIKGKLVEKMQSGVKRIVQQVSFSPVLRVMTMREAWP